MFFQMAENSKGTSSTELDVVASESTIQKCLSVPLKPVCMEIRKKLEYWKVH